MRSWATLGLFQRLCHVAFFWMSQKHTNQNSFDIYCNSIYVMLHNVKMGLLIAAGGNSFQHLWKKMIFFCLIYIFKATFPQLNRGTKYRYQNVLLPSLLDSTSCSLSVVTGDRSVPVQCLTHRRPSLSPTHSTLMTLPCTPRPLSFSTTLKAWSA